MATSGNIDLWASQFPQDQVKKILKLVLDSWKMFDYQSDDLEVPITKRFCVHLRQNKNRSAHFFRIDWESHELNENAQETGRIDLKFSQGWDEKVYFSIECKRLRVDFPSGFQSLAADYVTDGMYRYFNRQYASGLHKGGMLGYVMDGKMDEAIQDVTDAIHKRRNNLYMSKQGTLRPSSLISSRQVMETTHNYGPQKKFTVYHLFLPFQKN